MRELPNDGTRRGLFAIFAMALGASGLPAVAQAGPEADRQLAGPVLQQAKDLLGPRRIILRSEYYDLRRQHPDDPKFDSSQARAVAMEERLGRPRSS